MSILERLGLSGKAQQEPQQQQQQPAQQANTQQANQQVPEGANNNMTVPNQDTVPDPQNSESLLASYQDLWNNDPKEGEQANAQQAPAQLLDTTKLGEIANNINFADGLTPDDLASIAQGGEEGMKVFMKAINQVGRNSFSKAVEASSFLTTTHGTQLADQIKQTIPEQIRGNTVSEMLKNENPALRNPAVAPLVGAIEQQVRAKHPNATSDEVKNMTLNYFKETSKALNPQQDSQQQNSLPRDQDFSSFLN